MWVLGTAAIAAATVTMISAPAFCCVAKEHSNLVCSPRGHPRRSRQPGRADPEPPDALTCVTACQACGRAPTTIAEAEGKLDWESNLYTKSLSANSAFLVPKAAQRPFEISTLCCIHVCMITYIHSCMCVHAYTICVSICMDILLDSISYMNR